MVVCSRLCSRSPSTVLYRDNSQGLAVDQGSGRPELVELEIRVCCKPLGTGESLDLQLLGCNSKYRTGNVGLRLGALVCPSCQASQHRAHSSSMLLLSISAHGQDRDKPLAVTGDNTAVKTDPGTGAARAAFLVGQGQPPLTRPAGTFPSPQSSRADVQPCPSAPAVPRPRQKAGGGGMPCGLPV